MKVSAIVAMAQNRVIGKDNTLPWRLPEDLKRFKQLTMGHTIIMGRKTFESLGRILPGRDHVVLTRHSGYQVEGVRVVQSLEEAFEYCRSKGEAEAFVIGGAEIYRLALPRLDRLYLTLIHQDFEGDTLFPDFSGEGFRETSREECAGVLPFSFIVFERSVGK